MKEYPTKPINQGQRLRGVQHLPEADIQNIRDLLRGYGSPGSLLKEVIQNAEDAEAEHLDLILKPGDPQAAHPLLRTPGLCVINDGRFEPKHRDAIFRLGLGTKGSDPRAIGRYGKGLKSVFHCRPHKTTGWLGCGGKCLRVFQSLERMASPRLG